MGTANATGPMGISSHEYIWLMAALACGLTWQFHSELYEGLALVLRLTEGWWRVLGGALLMPARAAGGWVARSWQRRQQKELSRRLLDTCKEPMM